MSLKLIQLSKHFDEKNLYKKVDFEFADRGLYVIHGESGIGKTTLLNLIDNLDTDYTGEILLNETNIKDNSNCARDNISYCRSKDVLFDNLSVKDNLLLVNSDITKVESLLAKFNLLNKKNKLIKKLSQGQRSRIATIKYLLKDASVYLFDEPTENLDETTANIIFSEIKEKANNSLVIIVSHSTEYDSQADCLLDIKDYNILNEKEYKLTEKVQDKVPTNNFNYNFFKLFRCFFKKITVRGSLFLIGTIFMVAALTLSLNYSFLTDSKIFNQILEDNNTEYARIENNKDEILEEYDYVNNPALIQSNFVMQNDRSINHSSYISTTNDFIINDTKYNLDETKTIDDIEYFPIAVSKEYASFNSLHSNSTVKGNFESVETISPLNFYISDIFESETDFKPSIIVPYNSIKDSLTKGFTYSPTVHFGSNIYAFSNLETSLNRPLNSFLNNTDASFVDVLDDSHYVEPQEKNQFNLLVPKSYVESNTNYEDYFNTNILNKTFQVIKPDTTDDFEFDLTQYITDYQIVGYKEVTYSGTMTSNNYDYSLELNNDLFQEIDSNILSNSFISSYNNGVIIQKNMISENKLFNTSLTFIYYGHVTTGLFLDVIYQRDFYSTTFVGFTLFLFLIYLFFDHGFLNSLIGENSNYFKVLKNDGVQNKQIFKIYLAILGCLLLVSEVIGVIVGNIVGGLYLSPLILLDSNTSLNMFDFSFLALLTQICITALITFVVYWLIFSKKIRKKK